MRKIILDHILGVIVMTKSKILKFIFILFLLYLLYILITCTLVPLLGSRAAAKPNNLSTAENSEQVRCIDDNTEALLWRFRVSRRLNII